LTCFRGIFGITSFFAVLPWLTAIFPLSNKIGQDIHFDGLARAHEYTGITIPAVILIMHVRIALMIKPQNIHRAHVHANTALIAAGIIQFKT
jgi:hypothetical protein